MHDCLSNLKGGQETGLHHIGEQGRWGPLFVAEVGSKSRDNNGVKALGKLPRSNLVKPCPYVLGEGSVDAYPCYVVVGVTESLKPEHGFPLVLSCLPMTLEAGRVAGFHVDRHVVGDIILRGVLQASVAVLQACIFHCVEKVDGRGLPRVPFTGDDARDMVLPKDFLC